MRLCTEEKEQESAYASMLRKRVGIGMCLCAEKKEQESVHVYALRTKSIDWYILAHFSNPEDKIKG